jgi:hypothetical protein
LHQERPRTDQAAPEPEGFRRLSVAHFLTALVLLLIAAPFVDQLTNGVLIEASLMTLVLLSAVLAVGGRWSTFVTAAVLVTPAVIGTWINHALPGMVPRPFSLTAATLFLAFVVVRLLAFILHAPRVDSEVLCAAVATYLMLGLLWAFAYELLVHFAPRAFSVTRAADASGPLTRFEAAYFSFATLTTVGYGDIVPASNVARMLAMVEATTGTFFVTVLIARLVALYSREGPAHAAEPPAAADPP